MHHVLGNTISKLACDIIDTPAIMAAKSHLRNGRPLVIAPSTNNGLSGNAENIGKLLNRNNYYFLKRFYLWNACIYMKIRIEASGSTHGGNEAVCYIYICL